MTWSSILLAVWALGAVALARGLFISDRAKRIYIPVWTTAIAASLWPLVLVLVLLEEITGSEYQP